MILRTAPPSGAPVFRETAHSEIARVGRKRGFASLWKTRLDFDTRKSAGYHEFCLIYGNAAVGEYCFFHVVIIQ